MSGDWSELNSELLHLISKKLENFSNLIRFRSVCKQWRLAVEPADLTARLPYLLQADPTNSLYSTDYHVFSVSSNTTSRIKLPISHLDFKHSAHKATFMGFLLVGDLWFSKPLFLFNPLTETKLYLPFWKDTYIMVHMGPNPNSKSKTIKEGVHLPVHVIELCDKDIMNSIMFWQSNDDKVTTLRIPFRSRPALLGYYKGKLLVNKRESSETSVFDMETGAEMNIVIPNPRGCLMKFDFFVEAIGDLLGLIKFGSGMWSHSKFMVYRLEHTDDFGECRWIELNGIGERVLFLNIEGQGFCLTTSNLKGFRGNCIYHLHFCEKRNKDDLCLYHYRVLRYNMDDGTTEELQKDVHSNATWFVPSLS